MNLHPPTLPPVEIPVPGHLSHRDALRLLLASTAPGHGDQTMKPVWATSVRRADLVAAYPELDRACDALGFGHDLQLDQWTADPTWALLELARLAKAPPPAPTIDPGLATIAELVADLLTTHHRPLRNELRRLGIILSAFCFRETERAQMGVGEAFADFAHALAHHLDHEEAIVFPVTLQLDHAHRQRLSDHRIGEVADALQFMANGHHATGRDLHRLRARVRGAAIACKDPDLDLIEAGLAAMQTDLAIHQTKEDEILLPVLVQAAEAVRSSSAACSQHMIESGYATIPRGHIPPP